MEINTLTVLRSQEFVKVNNEKLSVSWQGNHARLVCVEKGFTKHICWSDKDVVRLLPQLCMSQGEVRLDLVNKQITFTDILGNHHTIFLIGKTVSFNYDEDGYVCQFAGTQVTPATGRAILNAIERMYDQPKKNNGN